MTRVESGLLPNAGFDCPFGDGAAVDCAPAKTVNIAQENEAILIPRLEPSPQFVFGEVLPQVENQERVDGRIIKAPEGRLGLDACKRKLVA